MRTTLIGFVWLAWSVASGGHADPLEEAMTQLSHGDGPARKQAHATLKQLGDPAFIRLTHVVRSENAPTRVWATNALVTLQHREAFSTLTLLARDPHHLVRSHALSALPAYGRKALPILEAAIHDPDESIRTGLTGLLAEFPELRAFVALTLLLKDPAVPVREFAAKSLGALRAPMTVTALIGALSDPHVWVKDGARQSLRKMGVLAVTALGSLLGDPRTLKDVRHSAAQVLAQNHLPESFPFLRAHAADAQLEVRGLSLEGLGYGLHKDPTLLPVMHAAFLDPDVRIRLTVIQALTRAPSPASKTLLEQALGDRHAEVRDKAKQYLASTQFQFDP